MSQVVIEKPIIKTLIHEPSHHFRFTDEDITNEIIVGCRISSYFVPIARRKKKKGILNTEWTKDCIEENKLANDDIRQCASLLSNRGHMGEAATISSWSVFWTDSKREKKLFFCQIEALETATYLVKATKNTVISGLRTRFARQAGV